MGQDINEVIRDLFEAILQHFPGGTKEKGENY
jgi:hypothetical protein